MNTIKLGSKGDDVKLLQKYLGIYPDGNFGPKTLLKVKEWQKSKGLTPDGIIGDKSWNIILKNQTQTSMSQQAPSSGNNVGISAGMINFICQYETGHKFGYTMTIKDLNGYDLHDAGGHKTYGYGLLYHPITQKFMDTIKKVWAQKELEQLFLQHAKQASNKIDAWAKRNNISLNQNQKDAIASACYNFGFGFLQKQICKIIVANPNNPTIRNTWSHLSDVQGKKYPGLIKRRQAEARWYFEGK
jgi:GH24 family phage-related lysozyme (muramidase)